MKPTSYIILYLFSNLFRTYDLYLIYETFYQEKGNRAKYLGYFVFFFVISLEYIFFDLPILTVSLNAIGLFLLTFLYKTTIGKSISAVIISLVLACFSEILVMFFVGYIPFSVIEQGTFSSYFGVAMTPVILLMCCLVFQKLKKNKTNLKLPISNHVITFSIPLICIFIAFQLLTFKGISELQFILIIIMLLLLCFGSIWLYDKQIVFLENMEQKKLLSLQNQFFQSEIEHMQLLEEATRKVQHDIKNHLLTMNILAQECEAKNVTKYIDQLMDDFRQEEEYVNTGNVVINGLCNYYISLAMKYCIPITYEISFPEQVFINENDLTIILGNLWNNCIENAKESENPFINFKLSYDKNRLIITTKNSYSGQRNKVGNRFISTKTNSLNHGIGLKNIEQIVQKYGGTTKLESNDQRFQAQVLLYLDTAI